MEKEEMTDVELLVDIRKASGGRPVDLAKWPNHGQKSIVPAYSMQFETRSLDQWIASGRRLVVENGLEHVCVL